MRNQKLGRLHLGGHDGTDPRSPVRDGFTLHREPRNQGGKAYVRCEDCGAEALGTDASALDGAHRDSCEDHSVPALDTPVRIHGVPGVGTVATTEGGTVVVDLDGAEYRLPVSLARASDQVRIYDGER